MAMRLAPDRYLDLVREDGERLVLAAQGHLDDPVPSCPGWTVDDVVWHVGGVYEHKVAALRLGRPPAPDERAIPEPGADGEADLAWCHAMLHALVGELGRRGPGDPAWTWWPADPTVGFWYRRMALETVVHRVDVELACGDLTDVPEDLAADGVDEVLAVMLEGHDVEGPRPVPDGVEFRVGAVTVSGPTVPAFLWLWGRAEPDGLRFSGGVPDEVRARVSAATQ